MVPNITIDKLQKIMYEFFDVCETNELTATRAKVEQKIRKLFEWAEVLPKFWSNYFDLMPREFSDSYTFSEFFGMYLAVESGEFLSTADPDAYNEPGSDILYSIALFASVL